MNETTTPFDYLSASIKSSRIPRFVYSKLIKNNYNHNNNHYFQEKKQTNKKFWKKYGSKYLNGKQSRIPVFLSNLSINEKHLKNEKLYKTNNCFDFTLFANSLENNSTKSEPNDNFDVKFWSFQTHNNKRFDAWNKSEPIDCLKYILEIVRSNSSADNKFRAIKTYRDKRLAFINQMESYKDKAINERVSEWIDRNGFIDNNFRTTDDILNTSQSVSNSVTNQRDHTSRRRSYHNMRAMDLIALNNRYNSFNSEISVSSISSIDSLLESRREDPEELLLSLGFGYQSQNQVINRIPQRFFESPSSAKGVNADNVRKMYGIHDIPSLSSSTSYPTTDFRERSYSCGPINDRFQKRLNSKESIMKTELPEIITSSCSSSLPSPQSDSILNPANRKFLESQGKEQQNQLSSKRLIIGTKSYKLDTDGDPLAFPKTPSPVMTPIPDINMEMSSFDKNDEQINSIDKNSDNLSHFSKRNTFQRQNCISDHLSDTSNDLSSELSSSTTTLVGTVVSGSNESVIHSKDFLGSDDKQNVSQVENQTNKNFIESALVVAIESLKLSLDLYRHQSQKMAKMSSQKYNESLNLTEEEVSNLSKIQDLRESIHKEIVEMDIVLSRHLQSVHSYDSIPLSFISQAQVFTEAIKKVRQLLKEQHELYSQMGFI